ncbi:fimbrial protein [Phytobacter sp. AG2a]
MKKLLIASSVLTALTMGVAHADPETLNGGTIEFIGEISDTTCYAAVDGTAAGTAGTPGDTSNTVILPVVAKSLLNGAKGKTAGLTKFNIAVRADITSGASACTLGKVADRDANGLPKNTSHTVNKVRAIFGGTLSDANKTNNYYAPGSTTSTTFTSDTFNNVDMTTGYLKNIAEVAGGAGTRTFPTDLSSNPNGSSKNVQLQLLNNDLSVIKVGDATSQMASNTSAALATPDKTLLPYYVRYISTDITVDAGMLRSFVTYDLYYE